MKARLVTIITAVLAVALWGAGIGVIGPFLPDMAGHFHLRLDLAGSLVTAGNIGSLLLAPIAGFLADRYGKKPLFIATGLLVAVGFALFVVAPTFGAVIGAWILAGALGAALGSLAIAIITDLDPTHVVRNTNFLQANLCLGAAAALGITARMVGVADAWRSVFLVLALCAAAILLLGALMPMPPAAPGAPIDLPVALSLLRDRRILLLALAISLYVGTEISIATWMKTILADVYHAPAAAGTLASGLFWLTMGIGRLAVGGITQRVPGVVVLRMLIPCGVAAFICMLLPNAWACWVGIGLTGAAFSGIWPLLVSLGCTHHPRYSGSVVALLASCGTLGGAIFPLLVGIILQRVPMWWGLAVMAGLYGILSLALLAYIRDQAAPAARETPAPVG